jgi:DNA modification methylase
MVSTQLINSDCVVAMKEMADNSVDSIVTDPPYGLEFMGKKWDYDVPSKEMWKEALRVLKPGGYLLSFAGSRTYHRMAVNIEDAGFEIRDQIMWLYGSGFPKSHNISKAMPEAKQWDGWGTALKPAHEPIVVARKPLIGTVVENVLKHGTSGINIDGCRILTDENPSGKRRKGKPPKREEGSWANDRRSPETFAEERKGEAIGRFPANVILDEKAGAMLDEQSDSNGASRFFYCAKPSQAERNGGCDNYHPTVKPVNLMRYLCRLVTQPEGIVLDPFMGSGTTGIAANMEGFNFIGIEMDEEYIEIARARITHSGDYEIKEDLTMERIKQPTLMDFNA